MKIQLKQDCHFTIFDHLDENEEPVELDEDFEKGDILDGDLEDDRGDSINFRFADGSMLYGLKKNLYKVTEED
jgi:hypothetical protein